VIVVSDTTPLNYLILIGSVDILRTLFDQVCVPPAVMSELQHSRTPEAVRAWVQAPPPWLLLRTPASIDPATSSLDRGEAEAISLAGELPASVILMDDRRAVAVAQAAKLIVVRTIAILELAAEKDLIDLGLALQKLQGTTFRISQQHMKAALARDAARRQRKQP
jgi:predicted nucleic acid-binding protein